MLKGIMRDSRVHKRIQEVTTGGYSCLKEATSSGYRVTENCWLVLFILELFSFILHFNLQNVSFFNFSVLLDTVIQD